MRSPVDLVVHEWTHQDEAPVQVTEWMETLNNRLDKVKENMAENGVLARLQSKEYHDKKAKVREFTAGSLVLLRNPGMICNFEASWSGPYEIIRKLNEVNVELGLPGRMTRRM